VLLCSGLLLLLGLLRRVHPRQGLRPTPSLGPGPPAA
jgi:hypothetical protein